jgi:hypothetical protein
MKKRTENKQMVNKSPYTKLIDLCMRVHYEFVKVLLGDIKNIIKRETEHLTKMFLIPSDNPYEGYAYFYGSCKCNQDYDFICGATSVDAPVNGKFLDLNQRFIAKSYKKEVAIELTMGKDEIYVYLPRFWNEYQLYSPTTNISDTFKWFLGSKPTIIELPDKDMKYIKLNNSLVCPAKFIGNGIWVIDECKTTKELDKDQLFDFIQYVEAERECKFDLSTVKY